MASSSNEAAPMSATASDVVDRPPSPLESLIEAEDVWDHCLGLS